MTCTTMPRRCRPVRVRLAALIVLCLGGCSSESASPGDATSDRDGGTLATTTAPVATSRPSASAPPTTNPPASTAAATSVVTTSAVTPSAVTTSTAAPDPAPSTTAAPTTPAPTTPAPTTTPPTTTSGGPSPADASEFLAIRADGGLDLFVDGRVAIDYSCGYCWIGGATHRAGALWIGANSTDSRVDRVDVASGERSTVYRAAAGIDIVDVAVFDGSLWIVIETQDTHDDQAVMTVPLTGGAGQIVEGGVLRVASSTDGRYLAYGVCAVCSGEFPPSYAGTAVVVRDRDTGAERRIGQTDDRFRTIAPAPTEWSSDGVHLLVDEMWEGDRHAVLEPFAATDLASMEQLSGPRPDAPGGFEHAEAACFVDPAHVAIARWSHPYAERAPQRGRIVVRPIGGQGDQPLGEATLLGSSMVCLDGGVVVATDDRRLVRITRDGEQRDAGTGYLAVLPV